MKEEMRWTSSNKLTLKWVNLNLSTSTRRIINQTKAHLSLFPNQKKWVLNQTHNLLTLSPKTTLKWRRLSNSNRRIHKSNNRFSKYWRKLSMRGQNTWLTSFIITQLKTSIKSLSSDFNKSSAIVYPETSLIFFVAFSSLPIILRRLFYILNGKVSL